MVVLSFKSFSGTVPATIFGPKIILHNRQRSYVVNYFDTKYFWYIYLMIEFRKIGAQTET